MSKKKNCSLWINVFILLFSLSSSQVEKMHDPTKLREPWDFCLLLVTY